MCGRVCALTSTLSTGTTSCLSSGRLTGEATGSADDGFRDPLSQNLLPAHHLGDGGVALGDQNLPAADRHLLDGRLKRGTDRDAQHLRQRPALRLDQLMRAPKLQICRDSDLSRRGRRGACSLLLG